MVTVASLSYEGFGFSYPNFTDLEIEGLFAAPDVESNDAPFATRDGMVLGLDRVRGRTIGLSGTLLASTETEFNTLINNMKDVFEVGRGGGSLLQFQIQGIANNQPAEIRCRPRQFSGLINADYDALSAQFRVNFYAVDPLVYGVQRSVEIPVSAPITGHGFPLGFPHGFGSGGSQSVIIFMGGKVTTGTLVTFSGPMTNPVLQNQTLDQTLSFNITLLAGEVMFVDNREHTVTLGGANRYNTIVEGDWITLAPGNNTIKLTAQSTGFGAGATVAWQDAWQ